MRVTQKEGRGYSLCSNDSISFTAYALKRYRSAQCKEKKSVFINPVHDKVEEKPCFTNETFIQVLPSPILLRDRPAMSPRHLEPLLPHHPLPYLLLVPHVSAGWEWGSHSLLTVPTVDPLSREQWLPQGVTCHYGFWKRYSITLHIRFGHTEHGTNGNLTEKMRLRQPHTL